MDLGSRRKEKKESRLIWIYNYYEKFPIEKEMVLYDI